ncbi:hypothetical protein MMC25_002194 [Agyrium rufum]|nr:hypothetical protein [Agyrium rufum]
MTLLGLATFIGIACEILVSNMPILYRLFTEIRMKVRSKKTTVSRPSVPKQQRTGPDTLEQRSWDHETSFAIRGVEGNNARGYVVRVNTLSDDQLRLMKAGFDFEAWSSRPRAAHVKNDRVMGMYEFIDVEKGHEH